MDLDTQIAILSSLIAASRERQHQKELERTLQICHRFDGRQEPSTGIHSSEKPDNVSRFPDRAAPAR